MTSSNNTLIDYLNTVQTPLDYHNNGRIPDGYPQNTIMLVDHYDDNGFTTPLNYNGSDVGVSGIGCMVSWGCNSVADNTVRILDNYNTEGSMYTLSYFIIDANGFIYNWDSEAPGPQKEKKKTFIKNKKQDAITIVNDFHKIKKDEDNSKYDEPENVEEIQYASYFWTPGTANYQSIFGDSLTFNSALSIVDQIRFLSFGVRFLPVIEMVTSSDTVAISRFYGGLLTPFTLYNAAVNDNSIYTLIRDSTGYAEYTNAQGCCARYNPKQDGLFNTLKMQDLLNINNSSFATGNFYFPVIVAKFTTLITVAEAASLTAPFRSTFRMYIEGVVKLPSPYVTTRVSYVPGWEEALAAQCYDIVNHPLVCPGHTFSIFNKGSLRALGAIDSRLKVGGQIVNIAAGVGSNIYRQTRKKKRKRNGVSGNIQRMNRMANNNNLRRANAVPPDYAPLLPAFRRKPQYRGPFVQKRGTNRRYGQQQRRKKKPKAYVIKDDDAFRRDVERRLAILNEPYGGRKARNSVMYQGF